MTKLTLTLSVGVYLLGLLGSLPDPFASPIWPATGFQIAMYFRFGRRALWAMTPGILLIQLQLGLQGGMPAIAAVSFALASWSAMVTEAWVARRFVGATPQQLEDQGSYLRFALIGAPLGTLSSALQGVSVLYLFDAYPGDIQWFVPYLVWWTGNLIGAYTLVPLLLLSGKHIESIRRRIGSFLLYLGIMLAIVLSIAMNPYPYLNQFLVLGLIVALYLLIRLQHYAIMVVAISGSALLYIVLHVNDLVVRNLEVNGNIYDLFALEGTLAVTLSLTTIFFHRLRSESLLAERISLDNQTLQTRVEQRTESLKREVEEKQAAQVRLMQSNELLACIDSLREDFIRKADPFDLFGMFLERLIELTDSRFGFVGDLLKDDSGQPYIKIYAISNLAWDEHTETLYASLRAKGFEFRTLDNLIGRAVIEGQTIVANDLASDERCKGFPAGHPRLQSFVAIPVFFGSQLVGEIGLADRTGGYDPELLTRIQPVVNSLGQIITARWDREARAAAEAESRRLALTDPLTGLANRRQFNLHLERLVNNSSRYHQVFSLIMLDLDHFKSINDRHGHDVGDNALIEFSQVLGPSLRDTDLLARWGGEEFIILLPYTDEPTAIKLAQRIHGSLNDHRFSQPGSITASIGVVGYQPAETIEACLKRLDKRLYEAKQAGRNCVIPRHPRPPAGPATQS